MIVVDPSPNFLLEPFIGHVVTGLSAELASKGYASLLQGLEHCDDDERTLDNFARSDALCVFPSGPAPKRDRFCAKLSSLGIPLALIEENQRRPDSDTVIIRQDDALGADLLIQHLLALGARRFLYMRPAPVWPSNTVREATFRASLKAARGRFGFETLTCGFGIFDEVCQALHRWLDEGGRCDVILANNDHIGIAVLKALSERGMRVPQDVMVTGFGGFELWKYSSPRLTTIVSPAHQLGQLAARALLERLANGQFSQPEWVLPVSLRIGETTDPAAFPPIGGRLNSI
jgi:LacI family transcriptional regulator